MADDTTAIGITSISNHTDETGIANEPIKLTSTELREFNEHAIADIAGLHGRQSREEPYLRNALEKRLEVAGVHKGWITQREYNEGEGELGVLQGLLEFASTERIIDPDNISRRKETPAIEEILKAYRLAKPWILERIDFRHSPAERSGRSHVIVDGINQQPIDNIAAVEGLFHLAHTAEKDIILALEEAQPKHGLLTKIDNWLHPVI